MNTRGKIIENYFLKHIVKFTITYFTCKTTYLLFMYKTLRGNKLYSKTYKIILLKRKSNL